MSVEVIKGNIFTSKCQTIVNTVNCVGVMGAGIALECRLRYPDMYKKYVTLCNNDQIDIGKLWLYKSDEKWILNFPTKKDWRYPSKTEYLHSGLKKFNTTYLSKDIESIAFPLLGADKGGIEPSRSISIMKSYLDKIQIHVEIYIYDSAAKDDLFDKIKKWLISQDIETISQVSNIKKNLLVQIIDAMKSPSIVQLNQLSQIKGIGVQTLEKLFNIAKESKKPHQMTLFDFV
jgi:O-acetyl-ADP-ribose deacetylase (regulator of RNase III)